ncbi:MAG: YihA family ribosome biogenesis GTP-binding protein [Candidatus Krumholzibacteriota bacterium]|nr:YihA family ribosome biogenesis GTP-binding protein [Candidatus Krumholzibacteriota bacterium]
MKIRELSLVCTELEPSRFPNRPLPEIAVSGRSNVGKSSLLNKLLGRKNIARVSKEPGKTRTINFYLINEKLFLVDLPGYGYAKVSKTMRGGWQKVLYSYIEKRENLKGVIQLVDSRHAPTKDDLVMIQRLVDAERDFVTVFTKSDKIGRNERVKTLNRYRSFFEDFTVREFGKSTGKGEDTDIPVIFTSSKTGEGKDDLWKWIESLI